MKIRLQSIEGRVGDPFYNEQVMEKCIEDAGQDGIDMLVFPSNSIHSESLDDVQGNERYRERLKASIQRLIEATPLGSKLSVVFKDFEDDTFYKEGYRFTLYTDPIKDTVEYRAKARDSYTNTKDETDFVIVCKGRGTESVCEGVYSNLKMIIYKGKVLAESHENRLDYEFDEEKLVSKTPYLDGLDKKQMFKDILDMQAYGLYKKMQSMNRFKICMGISGGLDSTVSLLVCVEAFKRYNLPLTNIIGVTMPGLGTTDRTYNNAMALMKNLGITIEEIDLRPLLKTHLKNISQPEGKFDVTFEQTQSRERTQVLLDIANRDNAIMIGTGCMSEFALGWMSYGGDHLCMFAINIGLPKTVVKEYARWFIERHRNKLNVPCDDNTYNSIFDLITTIQDILDGPVSPELLPIDDKGQQHEKTEGIIGDYKVQDFFIYHMTVNNYSIKKIFRMACNAFPEYEPKQILKWLDIFTLRYFTRAYKKNCYGDGLAIFGYSVSPKCYHVPSDIDNNIWKEEIEELKKEIGE